MNNSENIRNASYYTAHVSCETAILFLFIVQFFLTVALVISRNTIPATISHIKYLFSRNESFSSEIKTKGAKKLDRPFLCLFILLLVLFSVTRITASILTIARSVLVLMDDLHRDYTLVVRRVESVGSSVGYLGFGVFLLIYCALVYLWFDIVIVYVGMISRKHCAVMGKVIFLVLGSVGMLLATPLIVVQVMLIDDSTIATYIFVVVALVGVAFYTCMTLIAFTMGIFVIRATHHISTKRSRRGIVIVKMIITLFLMLLANLFRALSVISFLIDRNSIEAAVLMALFFRSIPDFICILCVVLLLWPYRLHCGCFHQKKSFISKVLEPAEFNNMSQSSENTPRSTHNDNDDHVVVGSGGGGNGGVSIVDESNNVIENDCHDFHTPIATLIETTASNISIANLVTTPVNDNEITTTTTTTTTTITTTIQQEEQKKERDEEKRDEEEQKQTIPQNTIPIKVPIE